MTNSFKQLELMKKLVLQFRSKIISQKSDMYISMKMRHKLLGHIADQSEWK